MGPEKKEENKKPLISIMGIDFNKIISQINKLEENIGIIAGILKIIVSNDIFRKNISYDFVFDELSKIEYGEDLYNKYKKWRNKNDV